MHRFAVGKAKIYMQQNMVLPSNSLSCTVITLQLLLAVCKREILTTVLFYILLESFTDFVLTSKSMNVCS